MATGTTVASRVRTLIQDTGATRWPDSELLGWINDAQREIALHKPEAAAITEPLKLTASASKQRLTSLLRVGGGSNSAFQFLDILRNMGSDGLEASAGNAIRAVSREVLDAQIPSWHSDAAGSGATAIKHFVFDARDPLTFFVYPKAPASTHYVEVVYAKTPTELAALGNSVDLPDIYTNVVVDYVVYRSYLKDVEYAGNNGLAQQYYDRFAAAIGLKHTGEAMRLPAPASKLEGNPNVA